MTFKKRAVKSREKLRSHRKMEDAEDDVAVIGVGCNFPGGMTEL